MPTAPVNERYLNDPTLLLALCVWREARGEPRDAKLGVVWTIKNRCELAPREGFKPDVRSNILKPWAFSSFMVGDPNATKYPNEEDAAWKESLDVAHSLDPDPTNKGVFYYSLPLTGPPKAWGRVEHSADIAGLHFYRLPNS